MPMYQCPDCGKKWYDDSSPNNCPSCGSKEIEIISGAPSKSNHKHIKVSKKFIINLLSVLIATSLVVYFCGFPGSGSDSEKEKQTKRATIPGISAVDIYGNLKNNGFVCSGPKFSSSDQSARWDCDQTTLDHKYNVEIWGKSESEIWIIEALVQNYSRKYTVNVAKNFLGYIATISYDGSNPDYAKKWVMRNISRNTNTVIGGVRFTITGKARTRMLTIENEDFEYYKGKAE